MRAISGVTPLLAVGGHLMVAPETLAGRQLDVSGMNSLLWIGKDLEFWAT